MANITENYQLKKPIQGEFYDVADQNGNMEIIDRELKKREQGQADADKAIAALENPVFEDYTGGTTVPDAATAINNIKSKGKLSTILSNVKAAFKGACLIGQIVNNCVTNRPDLPGSAAQLKVLMDLYTSLNNNLAGIRLTDINDLNNVITPGNYYAYGSNTISHKPAGVGAFAVEVYKSAGSYIGQRLTDVNNIHLRTYNGSAWSDWDRVTLNADFKAKSYSVNSLSIGVGYTKLASYSDIGISRNKIIGVYTMSQSIAQVYQFQLSAEGLYVYAGKAGTEKMTLRIIYLNYDI